jgi:hypothetical protein
MPCPGRLKFSGLLSRQPGIRKSLRSECNMNGPFKLVSAAVCLNANHGRATCSCRWRNEMLVLMIVGAIFASLAIEGVLIALDQIDA